LAEITDWGIVSRLHSSLATAGKSQVTYRQLLHFSSLFNSITINIFADFPDSAALANTQRLGDFIRTAVFYVIISYKLTLSPLGV